MDIASQAMPCQEASGVWVVAPYPNKCSVRSRRVLHPSIQAFGAITIAPYAGWHNSRYSALVPSNTMSPSFTRARDCPVCGANCKDRSTSGQKRSSRKCRPWSAKSRRSRKSPVRNAERQNGHWPNFPARTRNEAIARAYLSGQHTMSAVAAHFGVHYTTVSRLVKAYEVDQKV